MPSEITSSGATGVTSVAREAFGDSLEVGVAPSVLGEDLVVVETKSLAGSVLASMMVRVVVRAELVCLVLQWLIGVCQQHGAEFPPGHNHFMRVESDRIGSARAPSGSRRPVSVGGA